ncbi:hypothetical protein [Accumulibacter sp.]|uniref:phage fiber-tail adaptor protein n=1 Tax=Accumulibacter sp. TaxID=2053492 RepID=UPI0026177DA5|nr:hypothetical protein [Accumulibacter sp.]
MRTAFPAKDQAEVLVVTFDFASEVDPGETIAAAPPVSSSLLSGSDPNPGDVLAGSPTVSGAAVLHAVHGGVDGAAYLLRCQATLSPTGRVLVLTATLPVRTA